MITSKYLLVIFCFVAAASCAQTCSAPKGSTAITNAIVKDGYCSHIWTTGLSGPRALFVMSNNDVLVLQSGTGVVSVLYEGATGVQKVNLCQQNGLNHGVTWRDGYLYASSPTTVYRWPYTLGGRNPITTAAQVVVNNIPQSDHDTRTLLFNPEGLLYINVGSGANINDNPNRSGIYSFDLSASLPRDYSTRKVVSDGLRNEVGIRFDSQGRLWGVENGADQLYRADLGGSLYNTNPGEEINLLGQGGKFYGYPFCWSQYNLTTVTTPRGTQYSWPGFKSDEWCQTPGNVEKPKYLLHPHTAPLDIVFNTVFTSNGITAGDAFVAQHGSWNSDIQVGYAVAHVTFQNGLPVADEPMFRFAGPGATGTGWHRPVGLGWIKYDGRDLLLVSSDTSGVIIAISSAEAPSTPAPATPAPATPKPATPQPATPAPATPAPATPAPATPKPATATPTPRPATSAPATPAPSTPAPSTPAPSTPAPSTPAPSTCPSITLTQEVQSEWTQSGARNAVYNVILQNTGSAAISSLTINAGSGVTSVWGLEENSNHQYVLPAYAALPAGAKYSWGYIRVGDGSAVFTVAGCSGSTPAPSTPAPSTPAPSTPAPSTPAPSTPAPSTPAPSTPAPGGTTAITVTQSVSNSWAQGTQTCSQYDVSVKNTSPSVTYTFVELTPSIDFTSVQSWSITASARSLTLPAYVSSLAPGATHVWGYIYCGSQVSFTVAAAR